MFWVYVIDNIKVIILLQQFNENIILNCYFLKGHRIGDVMSSTNYKRKKIIRTYANLFKEVFLQFQLVCFVVHLT